MALCGSVYGLAFDIRPVTRQAIPPATTATSSATKLGMSWALMYPTPGPKAIRTRTSLETGFVITVGWQVSGRRGVGFD